ncbi:MAG: 3'-phosphoesterase [Candidatus Azobacteroides sp.]|nr:3'-phosphoesterase [Candidatus Azobacteroides sp.]
MSLQEYKEKRNFRQTPEPVAKERKTDKQRIFVVQKHAASHLHYDFRLEDEGVLKSWAVPKGPSMNPADKRLAVMVEDHPLDYASFEGEIPEGNYGAGIVEIWDSGNWELNDDAVNVEDALQTGSLEFSLNGKNLKGKFILFKMKKAGENNWLLIKKKDEYAITEKYDANKIKPVGE